MGLSIWQSMQQKGYSRRDFLQFCTAAAVMAGLDRSAGAQVASVFEKREKPAVVWMHFQECTCCSESFIRASHPIVADALLDVLSLNYTETLMAASGFQAEKSLNDTIKDNKDKYIVLVEGAVPTKDGGVYCMIGGKTAESILKEVSEDAAAVVAWGSCASNGCVQAAKPNPTGATPIHKLVNKPVINVPGCPPIADVMMGVVTHLLVLGQVPALDSLGVPIVQVNQGAVKEPVGITRANILKDPESTALAAELMQARLVQELRPAIARRTSRSSVETDLVLLQKLLTPPRSNGLSRADLPSAGTLQPTSAAQ